MTTQTKNYKGKFLEEGMENEYKMKHTKFPEFERYLIIPKKEWIIIDLNFVDLIGKRYHNHHVIRVFFTSKNFIVLPGWNEQTLEYSYQNDE